MINAILMIISGMLYQTFFLELIIGSLSFDRLYMGIFGGTQLVFGIFALLEVSRKEIKQIQLFLEILIAWFSMTIIINIYNGIIMSYVPLPLIVIWINNAVFLVMILINVYFYRKFRK